MSQIDREAIERELARLKQAYRQTLDDELNALSTQARALVPEALDRVALASLRDRLHRLSGSGGTFGLPQLSDAARRLETRVKAWLEADTQTVVPMETLTEFAAAIDAMADITAEQPASSSAAMRSQAARSPEAATGQRRSVWILSPDPVLREDLGNALQQFDYRVKRLDSPADADADADNLPDALIVDAELDGFGDESRWLARFSGVLVVLTGTMNFETCLSAAWMGADAVLQHPVDASELASRIDAMLRERGDQAYRVLIVDDDLALAEHYRLVLAAAGMRAEVLSEPTEIVERVAGFRPELILLDVDLSGYAGPDLATIIRYYDEWVGLPIVYLSAETDHARQIEALSRGADDFLVKPISDAQLVAVVSVRAYRFRQLAELMYLDSLTGLYKHGPIKDALNAELTRARRKRDSLSVAMIDIDHFKRVNDTYGHAQGDRVIRALAHLLKQRLRQSDRIGRYGGEEFLVIMPASRADEARLAIDDVRRRFAALQFHHDSQVFTCTLSAGVADIAGDDAPQAMLVAADAALYAAKAAGRDRVVLAGEVPDAHEEGS